VQPAFVAVRVFAFPLRPGLVAAVAGRWRGAHGDRLRLRRAARRGARAAPLTAGRAEPAGGGAIWGARRCDGVASLQVRAVPPRASGMAQVGGGGRGAERGRGGAAPRRARPAALGPLPADWGGGGARAARGPAAAGQQRPLWPLQAAGDLALGSCRWGLPVSKPN
jgi:hypothetical protein